MLKRMIQGIRQLFTASHLNPPSNRSPTNSPESGPTLRSTAGGFTAGGGSRAQRPTSPYPNPRLRVNGHNHHRRRDEAACCHNAPRLLRDGRLQIGIAGFHDTAFDISIMSRHDAPQLATAISDLPCRVKMVAERDIAGGLQAALRALATSDAGRRGIVLVTSGNSSTKESRTRNLATMAADRRIGIHVICVGPKAEDLTCGPRINTKSTLGYGGFRVVESSDELMAAIRDAFDGLTPAFGMRGKNKAVVLLDCSESMVEPYRNTTRIEMVIASLQEFLEAPLIRSYPLQRANTIRQENRPFPKAKRSARRTTTVLGTPGICQLTPGPA